MKKIICLVLAILICISGVPTFAQSSVEIISQRIREDVWQSYKDAKGGTYYAKQYDTSFLTSLRADGTYSDINYAEAPGRATHLVRLSSLTSTYVSSETENYHNPEVLDKIKKALEYFCLAEFDDVGAGNSGWDDWIAYPTVLGEILCTLIEDGVEIASNVLSSARDFYFRKWEDRENGAYRFCMANNNITVTATMWRYIAAIYNEEDTLRMMFEECSKDWVTYGSGIANFEDGESASPRIERQDKSHYLGQGIYPDGTYLAHGEMLYLRGYGNQWMNGVLPILKYAAGTEFAASQEKLQVLADMILESFAWQRRGEGGDFWSIGRTLERGNGTRELYVVHFINGLLVEPTMPRRDELIELRDKIVNDTEKSHSYVTGNKAYWNSDYMLHHREKYFASSKSTSNRLLRSENLGLDGNNQYYMGNGLAVYTDGREYIDAPKVWDWDRIPGLTAVQSDDNVPAMPHDAYGSNINYGYNSFHGVTSDGEYGFSTADYYDVYGEVDAKKAYFFFDDEVVALGAGLKSSSSYPLYTSMNQCNLDGDVTYSVDGEIKTLEKETKLTVENAEWIYHDNVGYVTPGEQTVSFANKSQTGNGLRIGDEREEYVTKEIFSAGIEHGTNPKGGTYTYILVPGESMEYVAEYAKNPKVRILRNDTEIQAVYHPELEILQAVFRKAGELEFADGKKISVDRPCMIMVRKTAGGYEIVMQNPEQTYITVNFGINEKMEAVGSTWNEETSMLYIPMTTTNGTTWLGQSVIKYLLSDMTCEMNYDDETGIINITGLMPFEYVEKMFVKIIGENGKSEIVTAGINSDYTYAINIDTEKMSGDYKLTVYTAADIEPVSFDVTVTDTKSDTVIFADTANHWVRDYAANLASVGIIKGDDNANMRPDDNINYDEMIKIVTRVIKYKKPELDMTVEDTGDYSEEVAYALQNEILPSYMTEETFNPDDYMTREDMITFIMAMTDYASVSVNGTNAEQPPADMANATYRCHDALNRAWNMGLIHGDGDGVKPFEFATRGEVIKIVDMILNK